MTKITLIAAMDKNNGIGFQNKLPWQIPEDLQHFKRTTSGKPILMGRKTYDSIGRPLPNRHNIVLTRDFGWSRATVTTLPSVADVLNYTRTFPLTELFVIGGEEIYKQFLQQADRLILTEIDAEFNCDAFFPRVDPNLWTEVSRITHQLPQYPFAFSFVEYERI